MQNFLEVIFMSIGRKFFSFVALVFAFSAFSTFTVAQETSEKKTDSADKTKVEGRKGRMGRHGRSGFRVRRGGRIMLRGLRGLNLTESQRSQIKTLLETNKIGQQPNREEMRSLHMKFRDGTATEDDKTRMQELRAQNREAADQVKNSVLAVLTPEQLQQLEQMKAERKQRMEERRQRYMERKQRRKSELPTKTDN